MPGSAVTTPSTPNKQLYNGGSEWQNDYGDLPDYQQTFYRNYDAALGRWVTADPEAEATADLTPYQYANNNPVMFNDPLGDLTAGGGSNYAIPNQHTNAVGDFNTWLNAAMQQGHGGLYAIDPQATSELVAGGGVGMANIYHAGDGTPDDPHRGLSTAALTDALLSGSLKVNFLTGKLEWTSQVATVDYATGAVGVKLVTHKESF